MFNNIFQSFLNMFEFAYCQNDSEWFHGFLFRLFSHDIHKKSNKLCIASIFPLEQATVKCMGIHFRLTFNILWVDLEMWRWKVRKSVAVFRFRKETWEERRHVVKIHVYTRRVTLFMQSRAIKSNSSRHKELVTGEHTSYANT